jgi:hypothetical protein
MSDDLEFLHEHLPGYRGYDDEEARHGTDIRVRAYAGEALAVARERLSGELDESLSNALEDMLLRCQFSDQVFVRTFEHATIDEATSTALIHNDREIVAVAHRAESVTASELPSLLQELDAHFTYRLAPKPAGV